MSYPTLIALTGGIGAGKSVVSKALQVMGYMVYDCDSRAKIIMDNSDVIKARIANEISCDAIYSDSEGECHINRKMLASIVFNSPEKLSLLNNIVHNAVKEDILLVAKSLEHKFTPNENRAQQQIRRNLLFIETAILHTSGIDKIVDEIWLIDAPIPIRIQRAVLRDKCTEQEILLRIKSQVIEFTQEKNFNRCYQIINDDRHPVLPQILRLLHH